MRSSAASTTSTGEKAPSATPLAMSATPSCSIGTEAGSPMIDDSVRLSLCGPGEPLNSSVPSVRPEPVEGFPILASSPTGED